MTLREVRTRFVRTTGTKTLRRRFMAVVAATGLIVAPTLLVPTAAHAVVTPAPNPPVAEECGIPVTLVLDASGSISSSHAVETVRNAASVFLHALKGTGSTARVIDFGSVARQTAAATLVTDNSLLPGGALANALAAYYNPIPPLQPGVRAHAWNGRIPVSSASNYSNSTATQYTNWDQSLDQAGRQRSDLVVFVTDGDPTAVDSDQPGDPFYVAGKDPPDVRVGMDSGSGQQLALDRSVEEANLVKAAGTRVLAVGVGSAVTQADSVARLVKVAGPQVVRNTTGITSLNQVDVAVVPQFEDLAALLRTIVTQLCSPSLTIRKLAQTGETTDYEPAGGWDMTVTPTVAGGTYRWIQPAGAAVGPQTVATRTSGFANFQWEPNPPTLASSATVTETVKPGFTAGPAHCEILHPDDTVTIRDFPNATTFSLAVGPEDIVTCTLKNNFNYAPDIALAKVNSPTLVRGDLSPPAQVTSSYTVTNPGNASLSGVAVRDDTCGPVTSVPATGKNSGDTDGDGLLDPGEAWHFTCTHPVQQSLSTAPINVVNTATVSGADPRGVVVNDTATDDYDVVTPAVHVDKTVSAPGHPPASSITVTNGTAVTYTYAVTNVGNVPLRSVTLADDTAPCTTPTFVGGDANNNNILETTETWTYTCTATPTTGVLNTATVSGLPTQPTPPGPPVTSTDTATVDVVEANLTLDKSADRHLVLPGTPVTYTYVATNTGTADLRNPDDPLGTPTNPPVHWVTDDKCADVTYVSGDANNDGLLNPSEAWRFTCTTPISVRTLNTATIHAVTVAPTPTTLTRHAEDLVDIAAPAITVTKTALVGTVLDPAANPDSGPDVPTPRPAEYVYDVANTGALPLANVASRITDNKCPTITLEATTDTNSNGLLDVDEVWQFHCTVSLDKADGVPASSQVSSVVTNTVNVTGTPVLEGTPQPGSDVTDSDTASVRVIEPSMTLTKSVSSDLVRPGDRVAYTYRATNTGDAPLAPVNGGDDLCSPVTRVSGDTNNNGLVDGADSGAPETWVFTCSSDINTSTTNTATAVARDPLGNSYSATATATVDVFLADIGLTKSVSDDLVPAGTSVTYTFDVTNEGQSPVPANDVLSSVALSDVSVPANPGCASPAFVGGDTTNPGFLDRTETWTYACSGTVSETSNDVAIVHARDIQDGLVSAEATAHVTVFHPGIHVDKTASPTSVTKGGSVTYTYEVTNTGDVPLGNVESAIADDTCSPVKYVSGDLDGDGQLDTSKDIFESGVAETWLFTCTTTVSEDTTNTVTVDGTAVDPDGNELCSPSCTVSDLDTADVTVTEAPSPSPSPSTSPSPSPSPSVSVLPETQTKGDDGGLPGTGLQSLASVYWGGLLVALGGCLVWLTTRRRRGQH